jgi:serine/threonine protein kinase
MNKKIIEKICDKNNLKILKTIHENPGKDSVVIHVKDSENIEKIIKICGDTASQKVKESFQNECEFYLKFRSMFIPEYINSNSNYIILEYFNGITLREFIKNNFGQENNSSIEQKIVNSISVIKWFHSLGNGICTSMNYKKESIGETLFDRIGNLATSGPRNSKKIWIESFIIRRTWNLYVKKLRFGISKLISLWEKENVSILSEFGHYDMHSENLLVNEESVKIIDFGNVKSPGVWISDCLYFSATVYAALNGNIVMQEKIKHKVIEHMILLEPKLKKTDLIKLTDVFFAAAEMNSRFRLQNKKLDILKILSFMKAVSRFSVN